MIANIKFLFEHSLTGALIKYVKGTTSLSMAVVLSCRLVEYTAAYILLLYIVNSPLLHQSSYSMLSSTLIMIWGGGVAVTVIQYQKNNS
jgi:hypothetical protein